MHAITAHVITATAETQATTSTNRLRYTALGAIQEYPHTSPDLRLKIEKIRDICRHVQAVKDHCNHIEAACARRVQLLLGSFSECIHNITDIFRYYCVKSGIHCFGLGAIGEELALGRSMLASVQQASQILVSKQLQELQHMRERTTTDCFAAITLYQELSALTDNTLPIKQALGELLLKDGAYAAAVTILRDVVEAYPTNVPLLISYSKALIGSKKYEEALGYIVDCQTRISTQIATHEQNLQTCLLLVCELSYLKATCLAKDGKYRDAIYTLKQARRQIREQTRGLLRSSQTRPIATETQSTGQSSIESLKEWLQKIKKMIASLLIKNEIRTSPHESDEFFLIEGALQFGNTELLSHFEFCLWALFTEKELHAPELKERLFQKLRRYMQSNKIDAAAMIQKIEKYTDSIHVTYEQHIVATFQTVIRNIANISAQDSIAHACLIAQARRAAASYQGDDTTAGLLLQRSTIHSLLAYMRPLELFEEPSLQARLLAIESKIAIGTASEQPMWHTLEQLTRTNAIDLQNLHIANNSALLLH